MTHIGLIECFTVVFNESSATVVEYENEVKQLYKEVAELKHAVYKTSASEEKWSKCQFNSRKIQ